MSYIIDLTFSKYGLGKIKGMVRGHTVFTIKQYFELLYDGIEGTGFNSYS